MSQDALHELARTRAQHDAKALKRTIKDFYRLAQPTIASDELSDIRHGRVQSLEHLAAQLAKITRLEHVTAAEMRHYRDEAEHYDAASAEVTRKIHELKAQLAEAEQDRARRIEYDAMSRKISALPDREKGAETRARLEADIATLRRDEMAYAETWTQRRQAFDAIVASLESMSEAIREEKAEQDRLRALDEDDAEPNASSLNPDAAPFEPTTRHESGPGERSADADLQFTDANMTEQPDEKEEGEMEGI
ncbi:hypothetical protein OIV83_001304 [Microbotryomycetes sp. JL201]|nr:hypothetical protein OIV83_001304 [Microbotryomycetes sp. JL201]